MTWAEFRIRLYAYKRLDLEKRFYIRELAWASTIGSHLNPKRLPKSKNEFWQLENEDKPRVTDVMKQKILEAQAKYREEVKLKQNG